MSFSVIIPARYASTRLPGKLLEPIGGKPMIQHVWERAMQSGASRVLIATDDPRILSACKSFGARAELTAEGHRSGTERIAELVNRLGFEDDAVIVNVQGDEPLTPPAIIAQVAENLSERRATAQVATLCEPITEAETVFNPSVVKVVRDRNGYALYFSRAPIPWDREHFPAKTALPKALKYYRHIGIYAYLAGYLSEYVELEPSPAETAESLEQLRILHHGGRIHVAEACEPPGPGVDTLADLERARALVTAGTLSVKP